MHKKIPLAFPLLLVLYEIATYLALDMYVPALPNFASDLLITDQIAQFTLTAWFLGSASMQLILGPLSDKYGRRPILLAGGIVFLLTTWFCAISSDITLILIARFFQGCVVCSVAVGGYSTIHELYGHKQAIAILALMGSITILAPALGPLAGSLVLTVASWRWIFWVMLLWSAIALIGLYRLMPETNPPEKRHSIAIDFVIANYRGIITNKKFLINAITFCLLFAGLIMWVTQGVFILINDFYQSSFMFGIYQAMIFGSFIAGNLLVKHSIEHISASQLIKIGLSIALIGGILMTVLALLYPDILTGTIIAMILFAGAAGMIFGPLHRKAIEACTEPMGTRMGVFSCLMGLAGVLASAIIGIAYNSTLISFTAVITVVSVLAFALHYFDKETTEEKNKALANQG